MPSIPDMPEAESIVGIYQNDVNCFVCITNAALYIYENEVWSMVRYEDIYYIKGPIISGDEAEKRLEILDKTGRSHGLSILGDTARPKATWAFAEMDIWEVRFFLWRVSDEVREDAVNHNLTLNESDLQRLRHYETSNPFYTTDEIDLAPLIVRWMKVGIEMEQGYTATIDEYVDELMRRGFLHHVCEFLSTEGRNTVATQLEVADRRFSAATYAVPYPILGHPLKSGGGIGYPDCLRHRYAKI